MAVAAVLLAAALLGSGQGPASAAVTAVKGDAYGYFGNVSLFGGPLNPRGPAPTVTLPPGGSAVPITASSATGSVVYGPASIFTSGPINLTTVGTTGAGGSVTTTANIENINTSDSEVFTADRLSSTCTASETGVTGSTTVTNGVLILQDPNPDTSGETGEQIVNVPTNPDPNTAYNGTVANVGDNFQAIFNEQIMNPDGSITVYAYHLRLLGPTAVGDVFVGKVECGVTSDSVTPTTTGSSTTTSSTSTTVATTTTTSSTSTTVATSTTTSSTSTTVATTTTTSSTTTTLPAGDVCNGLAATIVGTDGPESIVGTRNPDVIVAGGGNDTVNGLGGNDTICGGDGNDTLAVTAATTPSAAMPATTASTAAGAMTTSAAVPTATSSTPTTATTTPEATTAAMR